MTMKRSDIVVCVSGGVVTAIYAPARQRILLLDFDNLKDGATELPEFVDADAPATSDACTAAIKEAQDCVDNYREYLETHP